MLQGSLNACILHGLDYELLDAAEIMRRFPAFRMPAGHSAIWQPEGGFLKPELANALHLRLAREAGAEILAGSRVEAIKSSPGAVRLVLPDCTIDAASVVISAGGWITDLVPELKSQLFIKRQVLCWYEPKQPELFGLGKLPVFAIDDGDDIVYGFPDFAGTGFKCASHYGSGIIPHADAARQDAGPADEARTRAFLERYLPQAAGLLKGMKTCMYTMTPDEDFVIDLAPSDPRIVVASPCSGHGFKFASVVGEVLADLATDGVTSHDIDRFRIDRFSS